MGNSNSTTPDHQGWLFSSIQIKFQMLKLDGTPFDPNQQSADPSLFPPLVENYDFRRADGIAAYKTVYLERKHKYVEQRPAQIQVRVLAKRSNDVPLGGKTFLSTW